MQVLFKSTQPKVARLSDNFILVYLPGAAAGRHTLAYAHAHTHTRTRAHTNTHTNAQARSCRPTCAYMCARQTVILFADVCILYFSRLTHTLSPLPPPHTAPPFLLTHWHTHAHSWGHKCTGHGARGNARPRHSRRSSRGRSQLHCCHIPQAHHFSPVQGGISWCVGGLHVLPCALTLALFPPPPLPASFSLFPLSSVTTNTGHGAGARNKRYRIRPDGNGHR